MSIDNDTIINSQVFKFINRQIDKKTEYLINIGKFLTGDNPFNNSGAIKDQISVRTHEENHGGIYVETSLNIGAISQVRYYIDEYERTEKEIDILMSQKCILLNDWDYTKGDDTEQKEIFGGKLD